jgi:hypothetical protein
MLGSPKADVECYYLGMYLLYFIFSRSVKPRIQCFIYHVPNDKILQGHIVQPRTPFLRRDTSSSSRIKSRIHHCCSLTTLLHRAKTDNKRSQIFFLNVLKDLIFFLWPTQPSFAFSSVFAFVSCALDRIRKLISIYIQARVKSQRESSN